MNKFLSILALQYEIRSVSYSVTFRLTNKIKPREHHVESEEDPWDLHPMDKVVQFLSGKRKTPKQKK